MKDVNYMDLGFQAFDPFTFKEDYPVIDEGVKHDSNKPRWGLLPFRELETVVDVLTFGSTKYADDNWKFVDDAENRYFEAMMRHVAQYRTARELGVDNLKLDDETGKNHLAHAICCALFMLWFDEEQKP